MKALQIPQGAQALELADYPNVVTQILKAVEQGGVVAMLEFESAVEEIFDVQLLTGQRFPEVVGFQQEAIQNTFVVPPDKFELRG